MTVIRFFTLCPGTYPWQIYSFGVLSFYPPSSASATSGKLLLKHATSIKQYVSFSNHSTIYFYCQSNSSKNQFCWRILRMQPSFPSASPIIFDIFAALDPAPDLHMSAHIKTGGKSCISSPADARNVIWFSIRAVHSDQKICDLSSKRCFPVNWLLTYIAV